MTDGTVVTRLVRAAGSVALAVLFVGFGYLVAVSGFRTVGSWSSISAAFAAYGVFWIVAGPSMIASGAWVLASLGRNRMALGISGTTAILAGASLIAGVLTYVVPCSGPD